MDATFYPRLQQLRLELEASDTSDSFSRTVLLSIRRELIRLMESVPEGVFYELPESLTGAFRQALRGLKAPAPFPAPSWETQYQQTEQALGLVEEVARLRPLPLPVLPGRLKAGAEPEQQD